MGPHLMRRPPKYVTSTGMGNRDSISVVLVSRKCRYRACHGRANSWKHTSRR